MLKTNFSQFIESKYHKKKFIDYLNKIYILILKSIGQYSLNQK